MFCCEFWSVFENTSTPLLISEGGVKKKKVFLKILQNSQENTCARVSFLIKLQANFIEKETLAQLFSCEFCEIFKKTFLKNTSERLLLLIDINPVLFSLNLNL